MRKWVVEDWAMKLLFATLYKRKAGENDEAGDY